MHAPFTQHDTFFILHVYMHACEQKINDIETVKSTALT